MTDPKQTQPAPAEDLDEANLDQVVGGATIADRTTARAQEQSRKRDIGEEP